ncbi:c-type cytochrome [Bradyrhizobium elkanii]|uniref:c-type cytochrome n=1 Tax=Bradyrhizobium elkanii TaxID=29448 RepID=UPI00247B4EA8|nr:cytochrome c5 [Bradyrhizobium elkanii]MCS4069861.1 cytochrome c5 [Bradyrhizobium elkanii]MCS4076492.1 cytochrome c5 [Bradyrhizobium elkanii]MCW2124950.1 cytochrome c5 [Bradyrhizobium elkanii]MCW2171696.1 cytochrome c5 [Bradyrhizobium elkanii]
MAYRLFMPVVILFSTASMSMLNNAAALELKSVKVDLPEGDRMFPDGPGADTINNDCLACHSAGMVLNQPALSRQAWAAEVNKMINVYKAPVDANDAKAIVDYLANLSSKQSH